MQILYDNSIVAMKDMNLSIGIALTAEQINNLKDDIIWYVEEEVNGVNVLVPKVYLSKETLASLGDNQTGIYGGDSLNISAGSTIISENDVNLKTDKGDMNFTGTDIYADNDININSGKDINISSGKEKSENKTSSQSVNGQINIVTGQISGGISVSEGESKSEINKNSNFYAENNIDISGKDMTVKGGNIEGEHIKIDIDNLHVESLQDKSSSSDKSVNVHGSSDNKNNTSTGAGIASGKYDKEWVENQTSIIGRENSHITVEGNTHLEGGLLGGKDTTLNTGSLSFSDIKDHEEGTNIGLSENISKGQKDENSNDYTSQLDYSATDREQITHATVGAGTITVGGKEENPEGLNRDESKAQEITKDITVNEITINHQTETRDWNEVKDIMTEHGKNLGKDLDRLTGNKYNLEKELGNSFGEVYGEIEKIIDKDLKNEILGIIPTEATNGGIYGEPKALIRGQEKIYVTTYKTVLDRNGKEIYDENGKIRLEAEVKEITPQEYTKLKAENPDIKTSLNGILNTLEGATEGTFNGTLSPEDLEALKTGAVQKITVHNPSNGIVADLIESAVGKVGIMMNSNIGAKDLTEIVKSDPSILNGMIAHSQGTIKFTQVLKELNKTEEGRKLIKDNAKLIAVAGPAVGTKELQEIQNIVGKDKVKILNNKKDILNYMTGNEITTTEKGGHALENYNINFKLNSKGKYERPEELKTNRNNISGTVEKVNGRSTKSIIQRMRENIFNKKKGEK